MPDLPPEIDTSRPHPARVYDYLIGGKSNFAADRETAAKVLLKSPNARIARRENRAFLGRAVRFLTGDAGLRQFLDIGAGLPTANNVHEVAQAVEPSSRIVYVDNDPLVLVHARALRPSVNCWTSANRSACCSWGSCICSPMPTSRPRSSRRCSTPCRRAVTSWPRT